MEQIAEKIEERRKELGYRKSKLAKDADVTYQTLCNINNGKKITLQTLSKILKVLNLKIELVEL